MQQNVKFRAVLSRRKWGFAFPATVTPRYVTSCHYPQHFLRCRRRRRGRRCSRTEQRKARAKPDAVKNENHVKITEEEKVTKEISTLEITAKEINRQFFSSFEKESKLIELCRPWDFDPRIAKLYLELFALKNKLSRFERRRAFQSPWRPRVVPRCAAMCRDLSKCPPISSDVLRRTFPYLFSVRIENGALRSNLFSWQPSTCCSAWHSDHKSFSSQTNEKRESCAIFFEFKGKMGRGGWGGA